MTRFVLILLAAGCVKPVPGPEPAPGPDPDPDSQYSCATACDRQLELECDGSRGSEGPDRAWGTEDDISCEQACIDFAALMHHALPVECLSTAAACGDCD